MSTNEETARLIEVVRQAVLDTNSDASSLDIAEVVVGQLQSKYALAPLCCDKCEWAKADCVCK